MDTTEAKSLADLLSGSSGPWNQLWTTFSAVGAAIVGVIASGKLLSDHHWVASFIAMLGFVVFAVGNFMALNALRKQREAIAKFVKIKAQGKSAEIVMAARAVEPPSFRKLVAYHGALTVFILALLLLLPCFLADAN